METKVLSAIMKLQAAQIMCSNEGLHTNLQTNCVEYGSIELTVFVNTQKEKETAVGILCAYDFEGATREIRVLDEGLATEFTTCKLSAYLSNIK